MKTQEHPHILIPTDANKIIRKKFKCTQPTVYNALHYKTNSLQAIAIREFVWRSEARQKAVKEAQPSLEGKDLYQGAIPNIYETEANRTARINQENHTKLQSSRKTIDEKIR